MASVREFGGLPEAPSKTKWRRLFRALELPTHQHDSGRTQQIVTPYRQNASNTL